MWQIQSWESSEHKTQFPESSNDHTNMGKINGLIKVKYLYFGVLQTEASAVN